MLKIRRQNVTSLKICQAHQTMNSEKNAEPNKQVNANDIKVMLTALKKKTYA